MTDDDNAALSVGFIIDTSGSFEELQRLQALMSSTEMKVVADAAKIEQATKGMVNVSGGAAAITAFANAETKELRSLAQERNRAEKAGEGIVRQLQRQAEVFGKSASEVRNMRAEIRALAAEDAGLTELAGRIRAVSAEMNALEASHANATPVIQKNNMALRQTALQMPDIVGGLLTGQKPLTVLIQQGGQLLQVAQMAEGGVKGFASEIGAFALRFAPVIGILGVGTAALALFSRSVSNGIDTKAMVAGLGLTSDEIKKLKNTSIDTGDVVQATFQVMAQRVGIDMSNMRGWFSGALDFMANAGLNVLAALYAQFVGTFKAIGTIVRGVFAGKGIGEILSDVGSGYKTAFDEANASMKRFGADVNKQIASNKLADLKKQAAAIIDDRTPKKVKETNDALEAQQKLLEARNRFNTETDGLEKQLDLVSRGYAIEEARFRVEQLRAGMTEADIERRIAAEQRLAAVVASRADLAKRMADMPSLIDPAKSAASIMAEAKAGADAVDRFYKSIGKLDLDGAFGRAGKALSQLVNTFDQLLNRQLAYQTLMQETARDDPMRAAYERKNAMAQIRDFGTLTGAAKEFFDERSNAYKTLATAEKAFRAVELAMSIKSMVQTAAETAAKLVGHTAVATSAVASSGVQVGANMAVGASAAAAGVANQALGDPYTAFARMAAMAAAMAVLGFAVGGFGGGSGTKPTYNKGTGTVLGDSEAQSESITRALEHLKDIDTGVLRYSSQMAASLRNIEANIGGLASMIVRTGNMQASGAGILTGTSGKSGPLGIGWGFDLGSNLPVIGGLLGGIGKALFGTKTSIIGQGIQAGPQSLADILGGGFDAQYFTDVQKKKKTFGLTTSIKYSTQTTAADAELEGQFALVLRGFYDALGAAAVPLGTSLDNIQGQLSSFVVDLGRIDLKDKTGEEIQEQLTAVFSAAGDEMAKAAFPGLQQFQRVGEGYLETAIRVASSVEAMGDALTMLGRSTAIGVTSTMALVDAFGDASTAQQAIGTYFNDFYTDAERAAAQTAQLTRAMAGLGFSLPSSTATFRALVDAQDLTTDAGRQAYVMLMQLAPMFSEVFGTAQDAIEDLAEPVKSFSDITKERLGLENQLLQLQGNTVELRRRELDGLDVSNRALQEQIYALQNSQEAQRAATQAAEQLKSAWMSIADGLLGEVKRIRGAMATSGGGFSALQAQFTIATAAARGGDQDAARSLTGLSQSLLTAAADMARDQAELARIQGGVAASLEQTAAMVSAGTGNTSIADLLGGNNSGDQSALWEKFINAQAASAQQAANDTALISEVKQLRGEVAGMRSEQRQGHAAIIDNTDRTANAAENVVDGDAIRVRAPDDEPLRTQEVAA